MRTCKDCGAEFEPKWEKQAYCEPCCQVRVKAEQERVAYKGGGNPFCEHAYGDGTECYCGHVRQPGE